MSGFDLRGQIEKDVMDEILHSKIPLELKDIQRLSEGVTLNNIKLKSLICLFANFDSIKSITTEAGTFTQRSDLAVPPNSNELDKSLFTVNYSNTKLAESLNPFGPNSTNGWNETGVELLYNTKKVLSMEGANYTTGRPVAPSTPSPSLAGGRSRRRPYRPRRRRNKSSKKHSSS